MSEDSTDKAQASAATEGKKPAAKQVAKKSADRSSPSKEERREQFEREQTELRRQQGLNEDQTPERRPQAFMDPGDTTSETQKKLREEGSPMADNAPAHGFEEYEKANSDAQKKKAAQEEEKRTEQLWPGTHAYINNPDGEGKEHHGRAVAVNRVEEYTSLGQEALANSSYNHERRYAGVKSYECSTRDGRAELLIVSAEHLSRVEVTDFHRTRT